MRLLVISPSKVFRRGVHTALRSEKHTIEEQESGAGALRRLRHDAYDMLLLDAGLHDMNGIEFLQQLRLLTDEEQRCPLLYFSAQATYDEVLDALEGGVDDFLVIPFDNEVLRKKLTRQVDRIDAITRERRAQLAQQEATLQPLESGFVLQPQVVPLDDLLPMEETEQPGADPAEPDRKYARYKRRVTIGD